MPADDPLIEEILAGQDAYRLAPPSALPRVLKAFSGPVHALTHRLIPPDAIEAAIRGAD